MENGYYYFVLFFAVLVVGFVAVAWWLEKGGAERSPEAGELGELSSPYTSYFFCFLLFVQGLLCLGADEYSLGGLRIDAARAKWLGVGYMALGLGLVWKRVFAGRATFMQGAFLLVGTLAVVTVVISEL